MRKNPSIYEQIEQNKLQHFIRVLPNFYPSKGIAKRATFMGRIANKVLKQRALLRGKIFQNGCQHFACEWLLMSGLRASSNCDVHWPLGRRSDFLLKIKLRTWGGLDKWSEFRQWCFCRKIPGIRFDKCPCLVLAEILFKIDCEMESFLVIRSENLKHLNNAFVCSIFLT